MRTVAIIQARMGSTRLPNKVMKLIDGRPMIGVLLARLARSKLIDKIIVATSVDARNLPLIEYVRSEGYEVYQGEENDVLDRYYQAAKKASADRVVRITGDCPLVDPVLVDQVIQESSSLGTSYFSNTDPPSFPDGLDIEVFSFQALEDAWSNAVESFDREHVTPYLRNSKKFTKANYCNSNNFSNERWTVDEPEDFLVIQSIFSHFSPRDDFSWQEIVELRYGRPELFELNKHHLRNQGAFMGTGQKLWGRAKKVIPGGNMLLSKRAEMFLPDQWPAYFSKSKGCNVWDLDGNQYIDMSIMGIGTNILGYGHPEVDHVVREVVNNGNMATLNCPEEVYLAEKLVEMHPWADMVRFARTGGEANAVAIRIARASTGKDKVAVCGYHGWHDWYLSANLGDEESLSGHLLPGLDPKGVPSNLRGTVFPFEYNNYDQLVTLLGNHDIGVIKMEVVRNHEPTNNFLHKVRDLATSRGIVLIFDECTSGFRETFGGIHKKYGVEPDMAMVGKALGNGYAITATIGRREVMEAAQSTFISSTFWTERIGPAAALKTLEVMERDRTWEHITNTGKTITAGWLGAAKRCGLKINTSGLPALTSFSFDSPNSLAYKTFITQEMLDIGYLAGTSVYSCMDHTNEIVSNYLEKLESIFCKIKKCDQGEENILNLLKGPICHGGFKRLN